MWKTDQIAESTAGDSGGEAFHCCDIHCYAMLKCIEIMSSIILYICFYHYVVGDTVSHSIDKRYELGL